MALLYIIGGDAKVPQALWNFPEIIKCGVLADAWYSSRSGVKVILGRNPL